MLGPTAMLVTTASFLVYSACIEGKEYFESLRWPVQTFVSEKDFHPPVLEITSPDKASKDGYLFFSPGGPNAQQVAPLIMTSQGELVWNGEIKLFTFNFGVQTYKGEPVLVAWNGTRFPEPKGRGHGNVYLWNKHYEQIADVSLEGNFIEYNGETYPSNIDLHEHYITPNDTLLVLAYNVTRADLTSVQGPEDGWVVEGQVYEIDIETNEVLFVWKSLDHLDKLPFSNSLYSLGSEGYDGRTRANAWGYFHHNSVTPFCDGYIISSRYFCSAIAISKSGEVPWVLQGRDGGDFRLAGGNASTSFCYQHDIRVVEEKVDHNANLSLLTISMHDNANSPIEKNKIPTSGKIFDLDFSSRIATRTHRYLNESGFVYATAQGSHQRMSNGNIFEGHGYVPVMEEFSPDGTPVCRWTFGTTVRTTAEGFLSARPQEVTLSYRAFKQLWIGCPNTKPKITMKYIDDRDQWRGARVYISWNGATEVEKWEIWDGDKRTTRIMTVKKQGYETVVEVSNAQSVFVKAILGRHAPRGCCNKVESETIRIIDAKIQHRTLRRWWKFWEWW